MAGNDKDWENKIDSTKWLDDFEDEDSYIEYAKEVAIEILKDLWHDLKEDKD